MIAQRVIYFFRDLLDIKATRAAAAWLRLNNDGTVSERTAAQTLGDLGAVPLNGNAGTPSAIDLTNATGNAANLSVDFAVTSLYANDAGMAGGVARSGLITALLSDPMPITSGGTGGATDSAARTALGVGSEQAVQFGQISTIAQPLRIPLVYSNSVDFPTASTSFVNVTGLSFPVLANKQYQVMYWLVTNKTDANGMQIQFTGPASPTKILIRHLGSSGSVTATSVDIITAFSSPSSIFNNYSGDGFAFSSAAALLSNGANAGTVQIQLRAVTGGTAKIYAGSWIQVAQLN